MVPPAKLTASLVRTALHVGRLARPLAFKSLLMTALPGPAPSPKARPVVAVVDEAKPRPPERKGPLDVLDPSTRITAHLAPPIAGTPACAPLADPVMHASRVSLEELVPHVLRRIAWGGDRTKGTVVLELVSGETITVHAEAEGRLVRLEVEGNADLERRIGSRLRAAGIEVEGVR
jgi:hypothetical protein